MVRRRTAAIQQSAPRHIDDFAEDLVDFADLGAGVGEDRSEQAHLLIHRIGCPEIELDALAVGGAEIGSDVDGVLRLVILRQRRHSDPCASTRVIILACGRDSYGGASDTKVLWSDYGEFW